MTARAAESEGLDHLAGASSEWLRILEINPDAILVLAADERVAFANRAAARLLGVDRRALTGSLLDAESWGMTTPGGEPLAGSASPFRRVLHEGSPVQTEIVIRRPDGTRAQIAVNAAVLGAVAPDGGSVIVSVRDVTERRRAEAYARLLADAGRALAGTLAIEATMERLRPLVVPGFCAWCVLEFREADGVLRFAAMAKNGDASPIRSTRYAYPFAAPVDAAVRDRASVLIPRLTAEALAKHVRDEDRIDELRALGARSLLCIPLIAGDRVEGALTFMAADRTYDTVDRDFAEQLAALVALAASNARLYTAAQAALAEAAAQHRRSTEILESITDAFWALDNDWRFTYVNRHAEKVLDCRRDELLGRRIWDAFPEGIGSRAFIEMQRAALDQRPRAFEIESDVLDTWLEVHAYPSGSGMSVYLHDIGPRKEAEAAQQLIVESGIALSTTLDFEDVLERAVRAGIPYLADFCTIDLLKEDDAVVRAAAAAADPATEEVLLRLGRRYPPDWGLPSAAMDALRTGEAVLTPDLSTPALMQRVPDPELLRFGQELAAKSSLSVPLSAHGRKLGVLTMVYGKSGRIHDARDLGVAGDLARRIATALDNARLYEEAQESNRAKTNFISVISHEFRTPLTAIVGYADLLTAQLAGPLTDKQVEQLGRIKASAWHLTHLVEEILTFSRMDAGREKAQIEPVDVADVVQRAAMLIEPVAASKALVLHVDTPVDPMLAFTDAGKVRQILVNLLSNAVKFTEAGEVRLRATQQSARIIVEVSDTGIGIADEHLSRIFDSFWQVDQSPTRVAGGAGLGLTIARRLAHLLAGDIEATSVLGHGTTFTLLLPAGPAAADVVGEEPTIEQGVAIR